MYLAWRNYLFFFAPGFTALRDATSGDTLMTCVNRAASRILADPETRLNDKQTSIRECKGDKRVLWYAGDEVIYVYKVYAYGVVNGDDSWKWLARY